MKDSPLLSLLVVTVPILRPDKWSKGLRIFALAAIVLAFAAVLMLGPVERG